MFLCWEVLVAPATARRLRDRSVAFVPPSRARTASVERAITQRRSDNCTCGQFTLIPSWFRTMRSRYGCTDWCLEMMPRRATLALSVATDQVGLLVGFNVFRPVQALSTIFKYGDPSPTVLHR